MVDMSAMQRLNNIGPSIELASYLAIKKEKHLNIFVQNILCALDN